MVKRSVSEVVKSLSLALGVLAATGAAAGPALAQSPTISTNKGSFTGDCHGGDAVVSGNGNEVTLKGYCRDLTIKGNDNRVLAEMTSSGRILVPGSGNKIDYRIPSGGLQPQKTVLGSNNTVQQVSGDSETPKSGVVEPRSVGRVRQ